MPEVIKVVEEDPDELKPKSTVLQDMLDEGGPFRKYLKIGIIVLVVLIVLFFGLIFYRSYVAKQNTEAEIPANKLPIPRPTEELADYPSNLKTSSKEYKSLELFVRNAGLFLGTGDFDRMKEYVVENSDLYKSLQSAAPTYRDRQQNSDQDEKQNWTINNVAEVEKPSDTASDPGDIFVVATVNKSYIDKGDNRLDPEPVVSVFRMKKSGLAEPAYKVQTILKASSDIPQPADYCTVAELISKYPDRQGLYEILKKENYQNNVNIDNSVKLYYQERAKIWNRLLDSSTNDDITENLTTIYNIVDTEYDQVKVASSQAIVDYVVTNQDTTILSEIRYEGDDETKTELGSSLKVIDDYTKETCDIRIS